jgi:hypothetical protein
MLAECSVKAKKAPEYSGVKALNGINGASFADLKINWASWN